MTTTHATLDPPQPRGTVKKKGSIPRGPNLSLETRCWGRRRENPPFPVERNRYHARGNQTRIGERTETRSGEEKKQSTTLFYMVGKIRSRPFPSLSSPSVGNTAGRCPSTSATQRSMPPPAPLSPPPTRRPLGTSFCPARPNAQVTRDVRRPQVQQLGTPLFRP